MHILARAFISALQQAYQEAKEDTQLESLSSALYVIGVVADARHWTTLLEVVT